MDDTSSPQHDVPSVIRRFDGKEAARLTRLVGAYDDLQTVLRCCERLLMALDGAQASADDLVVEAIWTLALVSYGRAFGEVDGVSPLTEADLAADDDGAVRRHQVLLHLRDHHTDPATNPRETYTVGLAQDTAGAVNAVAVTSVGAPPVDREAVRQTGAMVVPLCAILDARIGEMQKDILGNVRDITKKQLDRMDLIEVAAAS